MYPQNQTETCEVCKKQFPTSQLFPIKMIRSNLLEPLSQKNGQLNYEGYICQEDLRKVRTEYIEGLLTDDKKALSELEEEVIKSLTNQDILVENVNRKFEKELTLGEKLADKVAHFGGSWKFILSFFLLIVFWMVINTTFFLQDGFDPYPFILLNLVLSCLAAVQAPVIMMSQNRQTAKSNLQANEEYQTNLKAELEIQQLHSKLDLFMKRQWESLLELQKIQIDLTHELINHAKEKPK